MTRAVPPTVPPSSGGRSVLLVTRGLDPVGTGRQAELAAAALRAAGHDVTVAVTTAGGAVAARLSAAGFPVHRLGRRPVLDVASGARLAGLVRRLRPAVVLAHGTSQAAPAAAATLFAAESRRVCRLVCRLGGPPRGGLAAVALRRADRVIVPSAAVAAATRRLGVPARAIDEIPPAAAAAPAAGLSRRDLAARLGLDAGTIWTLCVAPLVPAARLERLLWAIDQLGVVHRRLEHVLVGAGPLRSRLLHRARAQRLAERLRLVPHLDCLPDLLREVRLVWQSGEVACGGAILDGMAVGLPAVAVTSAAARQLVVDGETGRIVDADPESEFPRRALNVIEDDALAARFGAAARARAAAAFSPERTAADLVAAILRSAP